MPSDAAVKWSTLRRSSEAAFEVISEDAIAAFAVKDCVDCLDGPPLVNDDLVMKQTGLVVQNAGVVQEPQQLVW